MKNGGEQIQYQFFSISKDAWNAMYDAIEKSKKSIYWETYIFIDDNAGQRFVDILEKKARQGVEVKLVIDGFGSFAFSRASTSRLKQAGVDLVVFNPVTPGTFVRFWRAFWKRTHRKILVIDNRIGFIGGVNIQNFMADWLDLQLMIRGTIVRSLTRAFAKSYIQAGGEKKNVSALLHPKIDKSKKLKFLLPNPQANRSTIHANYLRAINGAKKYFKLAVPYYLPNRRLIKAMARARKRGVKIDLIVPLRTDLRVVQWAVRKYYNLMYRLGVNIYFTPQMMHGKAYVVDGNEGMVGSSNIDHGSFYRNLEANAYFTDQQMVGDLEKIFKQWQLYAEPFEENRWRNVGLISRLKSAFAELISPWL
ncbi:MAG: phospholipase D-like domain-containing protein [Patescibacteria group bacterium]